MANGPTRSLAAATSYTVGGVSTNYPTYASDSTSKFTPLIFSKKML
jgi:hypothetical protein